MVIPVALPASILVKSNKLLTIFSNLLRAIIGDESSVATPINSYRSTNLRAFLCIRCNLSVWIDLLSSCCSESISSIGPLMRVRGVRSSWDTFEKNCVLNTQQIDI